jgi:hypothetical protein
MLIFEIEQRSPWKHTKYTYDAITIISSSGFYVSNTSVSTTFTSIIHINFNGEHNVDWNEVEEDVRGMTPGRIQRCHTWGRMCEPD